jgi:hypothetical protein
MSISKIGHRQREDNTALAWALTVLGGALFLLGILRLISGFADAYFPYFGCTGVGGPPPDPTPALLSLKLAGWFVTAGWLLQYFPGVLKTATAWVIPSLRRLFRFLVTPGDSILEMLVCGVSFILLILVGMVSLWSGTLR